MKIVMISGSRNPSGQTAQAADALLKGAADAGATVDKIFLPTLSIERCRQCNDNGWGVCRSEGRCVIDDGFAPTVDAIRSADALIVATPVYFADLSESLRAILDRLRRTCTNAGTRETLAGKPAIGLCVAGGGGGGANPCCVSLEKVLTTCGFDVVDMIPVRRQNLQDKLKTLPLVGYALGNAGDRR